ncbi:MAG: prolipoprotein diacylglyceryl transferase [Anaerolineales bacterium]|nr:prolipoprotein diacylglyceryl transferase [Anaerolineales bacterium]
MVLYTTMLASGILAALLLLHPALQRTRAGKEPFHSTATLDSGIACTLAGLAGGRVFFILFHTAYYSRVPGEILQFWLGGMDWFGTILGVLMAAAVRARFSPTGFLRLCDRLSIPAFIVTFSHYIGCLLGNCMAGAEAGFLSFLPVTTDLLGMSAHRWPSAILAALAVIPATWAIQRLHTDIAGLKAALTLSLLSAIHLATSLTLGPPSLFWKGIRLDTIETSVVLFLSLLAALLISNTTRK